MTSLKITVTLLFFILCGNSYARTFSSNDIIINRLFINKNLKDLLNGIINHLVLHNRVNCVTILCDSMYLNIFDGQWFKRVNSVPVVMIVVDDPEDLLSPNYFTLKSLRQSRKYGCNLFIIFLANGIQASRFLVFGDRHRLIDTRTNFIMLHDMRLFSKKIHYLWKRIVNVVFIRHYQQKKMNITTEWYELTTVPFPHSIKDVLVPKRIQSWKTNSIFKPIDLFPDKTSNLKGHLIKIVAFQHIPAVVKVQQTNGNNKLFDGIEMEIINTIAEVINFKVKIYEAKNANVEKWGRQMLNGSYTGLVGEMVDGQADIALGNLHYTPYNLQLTDLSIPYFTQCLTFLTPESLSDNSWKTLILPFKLHMWIAVLLVLMVSGIIFFLLAQFHKRIQIQNIAQGTKITANEKNITNIHQRKDLNTQNNKVVKKPQGLYLFEDLTNSVLYTYGMLLVISLPKLPPGWSIRLLTGWYWLYCVLVVTSYRASMTAILANPAPRVTIDAMDQLADSSISCGGWGKQTREFFRMSLDETSQKIGKKFEIIKNPIKAVHRIIKGELAYYENKFFLKYLMARQELNNKQKVVRSNNHSVNNTFFEEEGNTGDRNLHIMRECAIHMPISVGLQKNSPLKPRVDKLVRKIVEAGLIGKWLSDVMVPIYSVITTDEENVKAEMNLKKLQAGFVVLGAGYGLSLLAFIGEIIHWKFVVLRDPKFDFYAQYEYYKSKK